MATTQTSTDTTSVTITIDDSASGVEIFKKVTTVDVNKSEIFKYAVWMMEKPDHITISDFDYLQSKIPSLEGMLSDYLELDKDSIHNISNDDRMKKLTSEAVGVGIGLKYAKDILEIN